MSERMICKDCKKDKDLKDFGKNRSKKSGYNSICKECQKIRSRSHYYNNKEQYMERNRKRRAKTLAYVKGLKDSSSCPFCEESESCCLEFHHLRDKKYTISYMTKSNLSLKSIKKEIEKCILLCANCHKKIHNGIIGPMSVMEARQSSKL